MDGIDYARYVILEGVSLYLASSTKEFPWYHIFADGNNTPRPTISFVLSRCHLNLNTKMTAYWSPHGETILTHEISFQEIAAMCSSSETDPRGLPRGDISYYRCYYNVEENTRIFVCFRNIIGHLRCQDAVMYRHIQLFARAANLQCVTSIILTQDPVIFFSSHYMKLLLVYLMHYLETSQKRQSSLC